MYTHSLDPIAFSLGPISIYWYGLVYALGLLFLIWYVQYRKIIKEDDVDTYLVYSVVGMLVGSRLFTFVFWDISTLLSNPLVLFDLRGGGMSFHGGFLGFTVASIFFCTKYDYDWRVLADMLVIPSAFFLAIGRLANFVNAELVGTVTDVSWCVMFPGEEQCRHPYQLYAAAKNFVVGLSLYALSFFDLKKLRLFGWFMVLYNGGRMFTDVWRDETAMILGITMGQGLSFLFFLLGIFIVLKPQYIYERFTSN